MSDREELKRYDCWRTEGGTTFDVANPEGKFVLYADHLAAVESLRAQLEAKEAENESLRKQLEEVTKARDFNARQCLQMQDEIVSQGTILRNTIAAISDVDQALDECRSSRKEDIKRTLDAAFDKEIKRVSTFEYNADTVCRVFYRELRAAVISQMEKNNG